MTASLPAPTADEARHSQRLSELIAEHIRAEGGAIPFRRFMELCLYAPGLGYYSAGARKFGAEGDFITAPELGPLFAECVAEAMAPALRALGTQAQWLELGGGSGRFAVDALRHLQALDALPTRYAILEPSADLRQRQQQRINEELPSQLAARVQWLDGPIDGDWNGVLFANEVIDALPTSRFAIVDGQVCEEYVGFDPQAGFHVSERPADALLQAAVRHLESDLDQRFADGYRSELLPQLPYWLQAVCGGLRQGAVLLVDYGYPRREYYAPHRSDGTLRAFRRQHVIDDVLAWPGLQDLTASVDFTALAEAGTGAGFELAGYCSQASFLLGNGLEARLRVAEEATADDTARLRLRQQAKTLTLPEAMGERFGVIGFANEVDLTAAFLLGDLTWRL